MSQGNGASNGRRRQRKKAPQPANGSPRDSETNGTHGERETADAAPADPSEHGGSGGYGPITGNQTHAKLISAMIRRGHRFEAEEMDKLERFFLERVHDPKLCPRDRLSAGRTLRAMQDKAADLAMHREKLATPMQLTVDHRTDGILDRLGADPESRDMLRQLALRSGIDGSDENTP